MRLLHVSWGATQRIVEYLHNLLSLTFKLSTESKRSFQNIKSKNEQKNDSVLQEISSAIDQTNPFIVTTSEKGYLSTNH